MGVDCLRALSSLRAFGGGVRIEIRLFWVENLDVSTWLVATWPKVRIWVPRIAAFFCSFLVFFKMWRRKWGKMGFGLRMSGMDD